MDSQEPSRQRSLRPGVRLTCNIPVPTLWLTLASVPLAVLFFIMWQADAVEAPIAVILMLGMVAGFFVGLYRMFAGFDAVEVDHRRVRCYSGVRTHSLHALSDLRNVRVTTSEAVAEFAGGKRVRIPMNWKNAGAVIRHLEMTADLNREERRAAQEASLNASLAAVPPEADVVEMLDVPLAAAPPEPGIMEVLTRPRGAGRDAEGLRSPSRGTGDLLLPVNYLAFPPRCVGCGGPPQVTRHLSAAQGFWLLGNYMARKLAVPAPLCDGCNTKRRLMGWGMSLGFLALGVVVIYLIGTLIGRADARRDGMWVMGPLIILIAVLIAAIPSLTFFWLPRITDGLALGVRVARIDWQRGDVVLRFRDVRAAEAVKQATAENRETALARLKATAAPGADVDADLN